MYEILRDIADSWVLLGLVAFFAGSVFWAFRPGSTKAYSDTVNIPFRNEDSPAASTEAGTKEASDGQEA